MNSSAILAIPVTEPERLFKVRESIATDYKALLKMWHPDVNRNPEAANVFTHIVELYTQAQQKISKGMWHPPGILELVGRDGKTRRIKYRVRRSFELGEMFIGLTYVTFVIPRAHEDLVINGLRNIGSMRYPDPEFKESLEKHMPKVEQMFETPDFTVVCLRKRPDEILLADLIQYLNGKIEPKHVAWITSSLLNLACYLMIQDMTHNALSVNTVFVSPKQHSVSIYGGWWYATGAGKLIKALPPETYALANRKLKLHKVANADLDLASIKAIGRACLGDASGTGFRARSDIPAPFAEYFQLPSRKNAFDEYKNWPQVLENSFGPRRYHPLNITGTDVYPTEGEH